MSRQIDALAPRAAALALAILTVGCGKSEAPKRGPAPIRVAAASDLTVAFDEIAKRFERDTGTQVALTFGSSGLMAKQLREGAPFDLFASANTAFVEGLVKDGACDGSTKAPYARGRLVVWTKSGAVQPPERLEDLVDARFKRIAIANPEHAPYGKAAQQALEKVGLFGVLQKRLVSGENIKQTMQFAETGNAEVALVALALALAAKGGTYIEVDAALHAPIEQALVVCKHGKNAEGARAFARFVNGAAGRAIMRRYGLLLPGEQLDAQAR